MSTIGDPTTQRPRTSSARALLVFTTLALALAGCGDKAATDAGTATTSGPTTTTATLPTTTVSAPPTTVASGGLASGAPAPASPTTTVKPAVAPTTTKKPGPSAADVAELERALDEIDKTLTDIQTELNEN